MRRKDRGMARPRCFDCGKQLMYVKRKGMEKAVPVWVRYVDPAGHEHRLHVDCARRGDYGTDMVKQYGYPAGFEPMTRANAAAYHGGEDSGL